jgi:tetratricopeptide (TPR) repeat protein
MSAHSSDNNSSVEPYPVTFLHIDDNETSIFLSRHGIQDNPCDILELVETLHDVSETCLLRFVQEGRLEDLADALFAATRAVDFIPVEHPSSKARYLKNLSFTSLARFERLGDMTDLDEGISAAQQAIALIPDHGDKAGYLSLLGIALRTRFEHVGDTHALDQAILLGKQAVELARDGDSNCLTNLSTVLFSRYERFGCLDDLESTISGLQEAIRLTADDSLALPYRLSDLGVALRSRYERTGDLVSLAQAISASQRAVELTNEDTPDWAVHLGNLGLVLHSRFERLGDIDDLERAISASQTAVNLTPDEHSHKPGWLNCLSIALLTRFERTGSLEALSQSIDASHSAVHLLSDNHPLKSSFLSSMSIALLRRADRTGDREDLTRAISAGQWAVHLTPDNHPNMPGRLANLALALRVRFTYLEDLEDLSQAISYGNRALLLTPDGHPDKISYLAEFCVTLRLRCHHTGNLTDLSHAISAGEQAVELLLHDAIPNFEFHESNPRHPLLSHLVFYNLGLAFQLRFERLQESSDISKAILSFQQAKKSMSGDHSMRGSSLCALGIAFHHRFQYQHNPEDLKQALLNAQQAVKLTPDGHPERARCLYHEGLFLRTRFYANGDANDLALAIRAFQYAAKDTSVLVHWRFEASVQWAECCVIAHPDQPPPLPAFEQLFATISHGLFQIYTCIPVERRFNSIRIGDVANFAAASAIPSGGQNWPSSGSRRVAVLLGSSSFSFARLPTTFVTRIRSSQINSNPYHECFSCLNLSSFKSEPLSFVLNSTLRTQVTPRLNEYKRPSSIMLSSVTSANWTGSKIFFSLASFHSFPTPSLWHN